MNQLIHISLADFKIIFRDPSLRIFLAMPGLIFVIVLWVLPLLIEQYPVIESYVPLVLMGAMMQSSTMFGFIYGMVLIHEKDTSIAKVYGILPISQSKFIYLRLLIPFIFATLITFLLLVLQPFFNINGLSVIWLAVLCGLMAPLLAILVSVLSKNKMEGMTWFKLINLLITIPLAAYFIPHYGHWFGIIPTHWLYQMLDHLLDNQDILLPFTIGGSYLILGLYVVVDQFTRKHFL